MAVLGTGAAFVGNALITLLNLSRLFPYYENSVRSELFSLPLPTALLLYGVLVPIEEEGIFRFLIFGFLRKKLSFWLAALISALSFGLYHANMLQFLYALYFGLILAYVYEKSEKETNKFVSYIHVVIVHGSANAAVYMLQSYLGDKV